MDKFKDLDLAALAAKQTETRAALDALFALDAPTVDQVAEATALAADLDEINTEISDRETAAKKAGEEWAALKGRFSENSTEDPAEGDEGEEAAGDPDETEEERKAREAREAQAAEETEDPPADQQASARGGNLATLAAKTKRPAAPAQSARKRVAITAAADVQGFSSGQDLDDLDKVAEAVISRAKGFSVPSGDGKSVRLHQFGTAMFNLDFDDDLVVDRMEEAQEVFFKAADETRLEGGSLVAAGGWCSPSETMYDLSNDMSDEGMVSLPEVAVKRGGIRYAQSPNFADFYANPGFIQTETQAIAGTTKPCVEVTCPTFTEVRLDAEGICIKVPILTNAAYPEVVRNFIAGTMTAHGHWINANVIGRMVTAAGAARVFTGLGSVVADSLEAIELVIIQRRQKHRLSFGATMEVLVPHWVKGAFRSDLGRRNGRAKDAVSDAEIAAHFAAIGANVQYLYDWQSISESVQVYPTTFQALIYPAGTFVKGTAPVINLNTVYDAASLAVNTYTGLFAEQGLLVAKMKLGADLVTLPICAAGRTGAPNFTCA